jgi:hypothetical protein
MYPRLQLKLLELELRGRDMTKARLDGLYFLAIGILLFLVCGIAFERMSPASMQDFRVLYNPARCLLHDCDPYSQVDVFRVSRQFGRIYDTDSKTVREIVTRYIYPPTAFVMTIPFALLP